MSSKSWRRLSDIYNIFDKDYIVGTIKVLTFATVAAVVKKKTGGVVTMVYSTTSTL